MEMCDWKTFLLGIMQGIPSVVFGLIAVMCLVKIDMRWTADNIKPVWRLLLLSVLWWLSANVLGYVTYLPWEYTMSLRMVPMMCNMSFGALTFFILKSHIANKKTAQDSACPRRAGYKKVLLTVIVSVWIILLGFLPLGGSLLKLLLVVNWGIFVGFVFYEAGYGEIFSKEKWRQERWWYVAANAVKFGLGFAVYYYYRFIVHATGMFDNLFG